MISLGAVEQEVKKVIMEADVDIVAVNIPDEKKGEQIVFLSTLAIDANELRKKLLEINCNPLMIPSVVHLVDAVPKFGSGKTDFSATKKKALELATDYQRL